MALPGFSQANAETSLEYFTAVGAHVLKSLRTIGVFHPVRFHPSLTSGLIAARRQKVQKDHPEDSQNYEGKAIDPRYAICFGHQDNKDDTENDFNYKDGVQDCYTCFDVHSKSLSWARQVPVLLFPAKRKKRIGCREHAQENCGCQAKKESHPRWPVPVFSP